MGSAEVTSGLAIIGTGCLLPKPEGDTGEPGILPLRLASDTRIVRHVRVKADANPFDPAWDSYFAQRKRSRMLERLQERSFPNDSGSSRKANARDVVNSSTKKIGGWFNQSSHSRPGGTRSLTNLKLLHSSCQRQFRVASGDLSANDRPRAGSLKTGA